MIKSIKSIMVSRYHEKTVDCRNCEYHKQTPFQNEKGKVRLRHECRKLDMVVRSRDLKGKCIMFKQVEK